MGMPEDEHRAERESLWRKFLNERGIEPDQRGRRAKRDGITSGSVASRTPSAFGTGCDSGNTGGGRWPIRRPNGGTKCHCMIASTSRSEAGKRPHATEGLDNRAVDRLRTERERVWLLQLRSYGLEPEGQTGLRWVEGGAGGPG
jgi:hypothetical protein